MIKVSDIVKIYKNGSMELKVLKGLNLSVSEGEYVAFMGPSGSGKSTLMNILGCLDSLTSGTYILDNQDVSTIKGNALAEIRNKKIGFVFQTFNLLPKMTALENVALPALYAGVKKAERLKKATEALESVGLGERIHHKPNEMSGGQRQRVGIARALVVNPDFIVADEPVSALDVSIQAQVVNMFEDLQVKMGLTYLFIAHDLSIVNHISNRIGVMYLGRMVELAPSAEIVFRPLHPYTKSLISAIPVADPKLSRERSRIVLEGEVPSPLNPPSGCHFRTRCKYKTERCSAEVPKWREMESGHFVACHNIENIN